MNYYIRRAYLTDGTDLCRLNLNSLGYKYPLWSTVEKLKIILQNKENAVFVAESEGRVIGYIHGCSYEVLYAPRVKNILGFAVDKEYRNNGVGTALLRALEQWAEDTGAKGIRLASGSTRVKAHHFYESRGYTCDKTQLRFIKYFDGIID